MTSSMSGTQAILSNREEDTVQKQQKAKALSECRAQMEAFVNCSKTRTISMLWSCSEQKSALNDCLRLYTNDETMERERQAFLAQKRSNQ